MLDNMMTCKKYPIAGVQFPLECGVSGSGVMTIMSKIDTAEYDFIRVDAECSSAYFVFEPDLYEKFESDNLFDEFKKCASTILNDVDTETTDNEYKFKEYTFWLGYDDRKSFADNTFNRRELGFIEILKRQGYKYYRDSSY